MSEIGAKREDWDWLIPLKSTAIAALGTGRFNPVDRQELKQMMGPRQVEQGGLFYNFSLDGHVPAEHLLRSVDRFVDLTA